MKSLMPFVFLIPILLAAAPNARAGEGLTDPRCSRDAFCGEPRPTPGYCPEGMHKVFDEYAGRYICVQNDDSRICPKGMVWRHGMCVDGRTDWNDDRIMKMSGDLGGDDMSAKGAALNGLFDAAMSGKAGEVKDAVAAPSSSGGAYALAPRTGWRLAHTDPSVPLPPTGDKPRPGSRGEARFLAVGAFDDLGNKLRDRNDEKLKEATKEQKDTEKRWKDYKEGKSVSPHKCPGCSDTEIAMTGKG